MALGQAGMDKYFVLKGHAVDMGDKMIDFELDVVEVHWRTVTIH